MGVTFNPFTKKLDIISVDTVGTYAYVKSITIADGTTISITASEHNLGTINLQVDVYEDTGTELKKIIPKEIRIDTTTSDVTVELNTAINGKILLLKNGSEELTEISANKVSLSDSGDYWTSNNVEDWSQEIGLEHNEKESSGLISGGLVTDAGGNTVNISAGVGYINTSGIHRRVTWNDMTHTLLYNGDNFLWIDEDGTLHNDPTLTDITNKIYLGYVYTVLSNTDIGMINQSVNILNHHSNLVNMWAVQGIGGVVYRGLNVEEGATPMTIVINSGEAFNGIKRYTFSSNITTFTKWYSSTDDGWKRLYYEPNKVCTSHWNDTTKEASVSLTGNVTFTNGSNIVTGSGTAFTSECFVGQFIYLEADGDQYAIPIQSIDSDTQITLEDNYQGAGGSGTGIKNEALRPLATGEWVKHLFLLTTDGNAHCVVSQGKASFEKDAIDMESPSIPVYISEVGSWDLAFIIPQKEDTSISNRIWDIRLRFERIQRIIHSHGNYMIQRSGTLLDTEELTISHNEDLNIMRQVSVLYEVSGATGTNNSLDFDEADETDFIQEDATNGTDFIGGEVYLHNSGSGTSPATKNYPFDISTNYTYGTTIEVTSSVARLKEDLANVSGRYHFNEGSGTTASDDVNSNDLTTYNSPVWVSGKLNNALSFTSTSQYALTSGSTIYNFDSSDSFSFAFWINTTSNTFMILSKQQNTSPYTGYRVYIDGSNYLSWALFSDYSTSNYAYVRTSTTVNDGVWHHIVVTYDGSSNASGLKIYVDGADTSASIVQDSLSGSILNNELFEINGRGTSSYTGIFIIDELLVFNKELSSTEVANLYNSGVGTEYFGLDLTNPPITCDDEINEPTGVNSWDSFVETATKPTGTEIKYQLSDDGGTNWYWWNGASWSVSDGTYSQSNDAVTVNSNISSFPTINNRLMVRALLHSDDWSSRAELDNIEIDYTVSSTSYPTTPYYVTTGTNQIDVSNWSSIDSVNATTTEPTNTSVKWLISFDGRTTWKYYDGSAWQTATNGLDDLQTLGMTTAFMNGLTSSDWSATGGFVSGTTATLDFAMDLSTTDSTITPSIDQIDINYTATGYWQQAINGEFEIKCFTDTTVIKNISGSTKNVKVNIMFEG